MVVDNFIIPPHLRILGDEAKRLHALLQAALAAPVRRESQPPTNVHDLVPALTDRLARNIHDLTKVFDEPFHTAQANADDAAMYRIGGRLEQILLRFIDDYDFMRALTVGAADAHATQLLVAGLREILLQIDAWLLQLSGVIDNPRAAVEAAHARGEGDSIELPLNLQLDGPPSLIKFVAYCHARADHTQSPDDEPDSGYAQPEQPSQPRTGFWATLGSVALAWAAASALTNPDRNQ